VPGAGESPRNGVVRAALCFGMPCSDAARLCARDERNMVEDASRRRRRKRNAYASVDEEDQATRRAGRKKRSEKQVSQETENQKVRGTERERERGRAER